MDETRKNKKFKGIKIRSLNFITIVIACILYIILFYETMNMSKKYQSLFDTTQAYLACERDSALLSKASDYLTEQVRLYSMEMDPQYMYAYFNESENERRRDKALEDLQQYNLDDEIINSLQKALDSSNALMETEYYSMKLISTANNLDESELPEQVREVALDAQDAAMDPDQMILKARNLVFGTDYHNMKAEIQNDVDEVITPVLALMEQNHVSSAKALRAVIGHDRIILNILLIVNVAFFAAIIFLVIRPLCSYSKSIDEGDTTINVSGAYEFQELANAYNDAYRQNAEHEELLRKKAERDPLTGIMNRGGFEQLTSVLENAEEPIALIMIDVDKFKEVNDGYGHDVGDQILKKVANTLKEAFRSSDSVARIGGDEFAVIMSKATRQLQAVIEKKTQEMNRMLGNPEDGLPAISLSVGVSFSEKGYSKTLFNQSDNALYQVKRGGRCGCAFYGE